MADTISVKITADVVDLQSKFTLARVESNALSAEINKLAKEMVATGAATPELTSKLNALVSQSLVAKARMAELRGEMTSGRAATAEFGSAVEGARGVLGSFGLALGVGAIAEFAKKVFDSAAEIQHQAEVLGLSTTAYQDFTQAGLLSGVAVETVQTSLTRFNAAQGAAQQGLKAQSEAFRDLGVDASLPAEVALPAIARSLLAMTDTARRARDETVLFSRSGQQLNPLLEQWAKGVDELTAEYTAMNLILGPGTSKAAEDAKIAMDVAWAQVDIAWAPAIVKLSSGLSGLETALAKIAPLAKEAVAGLAEVYGVAGPPGGWPTAPEQKKQDKGQIEEVGVTGLNPGIQADKAANEKWLTQQANQARQIADTLAQIQQQAGERRIASEEAVNNTVLALGRETIQEWLADATKLEEQRYAIELKGVKDREKADAGEVVKLARDHAEQEQLEATHNERLDQLYGQYLEKKQQQRDRDLQNFIKSNDDQLAQEIDNLQREYEAGQITAAQKFATEQALTKQIESQDIERLRDMQSGLDEQSDAYKRYAQQILDIQKRMDQQLTKQQQDQVNAMKQAWQPVLQGFDKVVDGIFAGNQSLGQILRSAAVSVTEDYIKQQIRQLEETVFTEAAKTNAVVAGGEARSIAETAAAKAGGAAQVAAGSAGIMNDAKQAAAGAYAAISQIPVVGPILAPAAAAVAFGAVAAFDTLTSFDVGTPMVPRSGPAMIHAGEMIVPKNFSDSIRAGDLTLGGPGQGGQQGRGAPPVHVHINTMDATSFLQNITSIRREISGIVADTWNSNPSLRPANR